MKPLVAGGALAKPVLGVAAGVIPKPLGMFMPPLWGAGFIIAVGAVLPIPIGRRSAGSLMDGIGIGV